MVKYVNTSTNDQLFETQEFNLDSSEIEARKGTWHQIIKIEIRWALSTQTFIVLLGPA